MLWDLDVSLPNFSPSRGVRSRHVTRSCRVAVDDSCINWLLIYPFTYLYETTRANKKMVSVSYPESSLDLWLNLTEFIPSFHPFTSLQAQVSNIRVCVGHINTHSIGFICVFVAFPYGFIWPSNMSSWWKSFVLLLENNHRDLFILNCYIDWRLHLRFTVRFLTKIFGIISYRVRIDPEHTCVCSLGAISGQFVRISAKFSYLFVGVSDRSNLLLLYLLKYERSLHTGCGFTIVRLVCHLYSPSIGDDLLGRSNRTENVLLYVENCYRIACTVLCLC